jgi:hypothetical protein
VKFNKIFISILLMAFAVVGKGQTVGDLAVISVSSQADTIKLIALNTIPANTVFTLTDNPWITANNALNVNEGFLTWTTPNSIITSGTIVTLTTTTTWTTDRATTLGTLTASAIGATGSGAGFAFAVQGDEIFLLELGIRILQILFGVIVQVIQDGFIHQALPNNQEHQICLLL